MNRVLDGERVQVELARERSELLLIGAVQADPGDAGAAPASGVQLRKRFRGSLRLPSR